MFTTRTKVLTISAAVAAGLLLFVLYFTAGTAGGSNAGNEPGGYLDLDSWLAYRAREQGVPAPAAAPAVWYDLRQHAAYWHSEKTWTPPPAPEPMPLHEALLLVK